MSTNLIDLTGKHFGRWTVLEKAPPRPHMGGARWLCRCECGTVKEVSSQQLRNGNSKSCGCLHYEQFAEMSRKHGKTKTRLYNVWASMRERCYCKTDPAYKYYGAKGIAICDEWQEFSAFEQWALENGYDPDAKTRDCTIDRIDNSKGYSPDNCRWVNAKVQSNNQSRNVYVTFNGETKNIAAWSEEKGWDYHIIYSRLFRYGWDVERALTQKPRDWGGGKCRNCA